MGARAPAALGGGAGDADVDAVAVGLGELATVGPRFARVLGGGADELAEHRLGPVGARVELRMELGGDEERVVGQLDHLDQAPVGGRAAGDQALAVRAGVRRKQVDLVAMAVALVDDASPKISSARVLVQSLTGSAPRRIVPPMSRRLLSARAAGRSPGTASRGRTRRSWRPPSRPRGGRTRPPRSASRGRSPGTGSSARGAICAARDLALDAALAEAAGDRGSRRRPASASLARGARNRPAGCRR